MTGIGAQLADLSWRDAWRHEPRGPHGEWVRSALVSSEDFYDTIAALPSNSALIDVQDALNEAADHMAAKNTGAAVRKLRDAAAAASSGGYDDDAFKLRDLAARLAMEPPPAAAAVRPLSPVTHPYGKEHYGSVGELSGIDWPTEEMRAEAKAEVQHGLDLQGRFVPKIAEKADISLSGLDDDTNGETLNGRQVLIDPANAQMYGNWVRKWDGSTPDEIMKRDQENGFWVPSDPQYTLTDTVVAHEMGHVIAYEVAHRYSADLWKKLAEAAGLLPPEAGPKGATVSPAKLADWAMKNYYALSQYVSGYGMSSMPEMFAEMWSEYTMSANPRPVAKAYGEWVTGRLREAGKL